MAEKKKANRITDEIDFSLKVRFFSRKPVERSVYSDHKTGGHGFWLANREENARGIIWGLLCFFLPVILNNVSDTSWHATPGASSLLSGGADCNLRSPLCLFLPSSLLMQEWSETKVQGKKTNKYSLSCLT